MFQLSLALLAYLLPQSQIAVPTQATAVPALIIAIDQAVYTSQPLWIRAVNGQNIRYPFHPAAGDMGCNRLEVKRNGVLLTPLAVHGTAVMSGPVCGSAAPKGSPEHRLPLHVLYPLDAPGTYSVRWTEIANGPYTAAGGPKPQAQSDWLTFEVLQTTPKQHEDWIRNLLADPPEDPGRLAGDFLPSLLAAAPDTRALNVFVKYLYSNNSMVSGISASSLEHFPQAEVIRAVAESIEQHGPSDQLAYFASYHRGWTHEDESTIVHAAVRYLQSTNSSLLSTKQLPPYAPTQTSAAIKLLRFIFYVPNHAWPEDPKLAEYSDTQILQAAPGIIQTSNEQTVQELSEYLGVIQPNTRAHELLLQIAERSDNAGAQARSCLSWHR